MSFLGLPSTAEACSVDAFGIFSLASAHNRSRAKAPTLLALLKAVLAFTEELELLTLPAASIQT